MYVASWLSYELGLLDILLNLICTQLASMANQVSNLESLYTRLLAMGTGMEESQKVAMYLQSLEKGINLQRKHFSGNDEWENSDEELGDKYFNRRYSKTKRSHWVQGCYLIVSVCLHMFYLHLVQIPEKIIYLTSVTHVGLFPGSVGHQKMGNIQDRRALGVNDTIKKNQKQIITEKLGSE